MIEANSPSSNDQENQLTALQLNGIAETHVGCALEWELENMVGRHEVLRAVLKLLSQQLEKSFPEYDSGVIISNLENLVRQQCSQKEECEELLNVFATIGKMEKFSDVIPQRLVLIMKHYVDNVLYKIDENGFEFSNNASLEKIASDAKEKLKEKQKKLEKDNAKIIEKNKRAKKRDRRIGLLTMYASFLLYGSIMAVGAAALFYFTAIKISYFSAFQLLPVDLFLGGVFTVFLEVSCRLCFEKSLMQIVCLPLINRYVGEESIISQNELDQQEALLAHYEENNSDQNPNSYGVNILPSLGVTATDVSIDVDPEDVTSINQNSETRSNNNNNSLQINASSSVEPSHLSQVVIDSQTTAAESSEVNRYLAKFMSSSS